MKKRASAPVQQQSATALQSRFQQALALLQRGRLADAERIYQEILRQQPNHVDALHMQGLIALQGERMERAVELIGKAVRLNGQIPAAHSNLGNALRALKRPGEALARYDKAIALKPDYALAYGNRGNALRDLQRSGEALASHDKAIALRPECAEAQQPWQCAAGPANVPRTRWPAMTGR